MTERGRRRLAVAVAWLALLALAGCGSTGVSTRSALTETVRLVRHGAAPSFVTSLQAAPGDEVEFRTRLRGRGRTARTVTIVLERGPSHELTISASASGQTSQVQVLGAGGQSIALARVRYVCDVPPHPTFCPARSIAVDPARYSLQFDATPRAPIVIDSVLDRVAPPGSVAPPPAARGGRPYRIIEELRVLSRSAAVPSGYAASVTAGAGDQVQVRLRAGGAPGARQPLSVSVSLGPARQLTVRASLPGGQAVSGTITASAGNLRVSSVRYVCALAPTPSACPPSAIATAGGEDTVTFPIAPRIPVVLSLVLVAG